MGATDQKNSRKRKRDDDDKKEAPTIKLLSTKDLANRLCVLSVATMLEKCIESSAAHIIWFGHHLPQTKILPDGSRLIYLHFPERSLQRFVIRIIRRWASRKETETIYQYRSMLVLHARSWSTLPLRIVAAYGYRVHDFRVLGRQRKTFISYGGGISPEFKEEYNIEHLDFAPGLLGVARLLLAELAVFDVPYSEGAEGLERWHTWLHNQMGQNAEVYQPSNTDDGEAAREARAREVTRLTKILWFYPLLRWYPLQFGADRRTTDLSHLKKYT